jgi:hypothetical protein
VGSLGEMLGYFGGFEAEYEEGVAGDEKIIEWMSMWEGPLGPKVCSRWVSEVQGGCKFSMCIGQGHLIQYIALPHIF